MGLPPVKMSFTNRTLVGIWKIVYAPVVRRAARQILKGRLIDPNAPTKGRWLEADVRHFLRRTWERTDDLLLIAEMDKLPTFGNRHNVFLALVTTSAYQILIEGGVSAEYACTLVGDVGWKIYSWMLATVSLPVRVITRDPGRRIEKTLRMLTVFPFSAPGRPGYGVTIWTKGNDTFTHWTHCPPLAFVRRVVAATGNRGELEAFRRSWCLYDWPGADLLAADNRHGHYSRPHTMSRGDSICDMGWHGTPRAKRRPRR